MDKKQKYLKLILSITLSSLLTVLVVFSVVHAQSYLRGSQGDPAIPALRVEGRAESWGGAYLNSTGAANSTGLVVLGKVGIGLPFVSAEPSAELDVDGWIRASGARFNTVRIDDDLYVNNQVDPVSIYTAVCDDGEKSRSGNNQIIEEWCGGANSLPSNLCVPFLQNFKHNDPNDPDNIKELYCAINSRRLFVHVNTEGGDNDEIGKGSRCGAICGLEINYR
ncbi:MAG: hypothetical protein KJI72_02650 [Patescibacteria group bacterium]|nr:hypothetical protein [Patescibacteria group bacterium]